MKKLITMLAVFTVWATCLQAQNWSLTGNSGLTVPTNFLGTTDLKAIVFKTNNVFSGIIDPDLRNAAIGYQSLFSNTGSLNVAIGYQAMYANTSGGDNTAVGEGALRFATTAGTNTAVGEYALYSATTGSLNTTIGGESLTNVTTGACNTAVGAFSLSGCYTGNYNTAIGYDADFTVSSTSYTNTTAIGNSAIVTASNQIRLGSTGVTSIGGTVGWTTFSDGRFKANVQENVPGLDFIKQLRTVTYSLNTAALRKFLRPEEKRDKNGKLISRPSADASADGQDKIIYSGFIAQEVETAAEKMGYDFHGVDKPKNSNDLYGLRYAEFVVPLVKSVQELSSANDSLKNALTTLANEHQQLQSQVKDILLELQRLKGVQTGNTTAAGASLQQNAPNPFSSNTLIRYFVPVTAASAQLVIRNASGQSLKVLSLSAKGDGIATLSGGTLAAGNYFYSLVVDGIQVDTKQMVLTK